MYDSILDAICNGRMAPGERIAQDMVAEKLNVSRQPVGQALMILRKQNFVREAGRRGLIVAPLEAKFIAAVYEFRSAIDPLASSLAAKHATAENKAEGERIIIAGKKALASRSLQRLINADMDFHLLIYAVSGNILVQEIMATHWHHLRRAMREVLSRDDYRATLWDEHDDIWGAISSGDPKSAERVMRKHVVAASDFLESKVLHALEEREKA
ncbi:MAG: GntR family transcriptional regulator [Pseudomonadota bacterium]|nr:GntR family transcriptional regulator [Pseudomonadota bacterium]